MKIDLIINYLKRSLLVVILIIGLTLIHQSVSLGELDLNEVMVSKNNTINASTYIIYLQSSIHKYRILGVLIFAFSAVALLLEIYLKKHD